MIQNEDPWDPLEGRLSKKILPRVGPERSISLSTRVLVPWKGSNDL
jgi:hypothetical protein